MRKPIVLNAVLLLAAAAITSTVILTKNPEPQTAAPAPAKSKDELSREHARELVAKYKDYQLVDAHNHDAWYGSSFSLWDQFAVPLRGRVRPSDH